MTLIFHWECCEHKKGPVGSQMGSLAFTCLFTPFYSPSLSPLKKAAQILGVSPTQFIATK